MFILITTLILFITALALTVLMVMRPGFRYAWLTAVGGAFLTWVSVMLWQIFMPLMLDLPAWQSSKVFPDTPSFLADRMAWPYALGLASLALALILTSVSREDFPDPLSWAGTLTLTGLGVLAILARNPLTLALVWAAIDLAELVAQIRSARGERANERAVTGFAARASGIGLLIWAGMVSLSSGSPLDFQTVRPNVGMILILAVGLRLGVFPLNPTYSSGTGQRGFGTALRMISAASSLVLLARIPSASALSPFGPFLLVLIAIAAVFGGLQWMRATDELSGRPFWIIGMASLAMASTLRGNPLGSVAWGAALVLAGSVLFLSSAQNKIIARVSLALGVWGISSLPFSASASGWQSGVPATWAVWITWPFLLAAQGLLVAGFIRHILIPSPSVPLESQPVWSKNIHPFGIGILLFSLTLLGFFGWEGALKLGAPLAGLVAAAFTAAFYWLRPRLPYLNPMRAHWVQPEGSSRLDAIYGFLWGLYRQVGRLSAFLASLLEGDGGILWAMLFLILFLTLLAPKASLP